MYFKYNTGFLFANIYLSVHDLSNWIFLLNYCVTKKYISHFDLQYCVVCYVFYKYNIYNILLYADRPQNMTHKNDSTFFIKQMCQNHFEVRDMTFPANGSLLTGLGFPTLKKKRSILNNNKYKCNTHRVLSVGWNNFYTFFSHLCTFLNVSKQFCLKL